MSKGKLINHRLYNGSAGHKVGGAHATVPDETYTIRELFLRYARGTMPPIGRNMFDGAEDADFDDPDQEEVMRMDVVDQRELVQEVRERGMRALRERNRKREREKEDPSPGKDPSKDVSKEPKQGEGSK